MPQAPQRPATPARALARLTAAALGCSCLLGATCSNRPDDKARDQAAIHYDLGVQAMTNCDARAALGEYQQAVRLDPNLDVAQNALALVYHLSFQQYDDAIQHYRRALDINPKLTEAYTNLGNVYLDQNRCDEAIPLYEKALADILYKTPFIAENNLGWCLYKKGQVKEGVDHIRSALVTNPQFCLGHRNLGLIFSETGQQQKALESFAKFVRSCPDSPDAHFRYAKALLTSGDTEAARRELKVCVQKGRDEVGDPSQPPNPNAPKRCRSVQEQALADDCAGLLSEFEKR